MDIITTLEEAIAARLEILKDYGLDIINSPKRCNSRRAIALFYFTGESAEEVKGCTQNSDIRITVQVQLCDMRSHQPAYPYVAAIKQCLNGFAPKVGKTGHIYYLSTDYNPYEVKNGIEWVYTMTFGLKLLQVKIGAGNLEEAIAQIFAGE